MPRLRSAVSTCVLVLTLICSNAVAGPTACPSPPHPAGPLVSLEAVAVNGVPIDPTNCVHANRGDIVTAEIFVSGWGPILDGIGGLRAYVVRFDALAAAQSGSHGLVVPLGWDAPLATLEETILCGTDADCLPLPGTSCVFDPDASDICAGANHDPDRGLFVDVSRPDFVLAGFETVQSVLHTSLQLIEYASGSTSGSGAVGAIDAYYAGTLLLRVDLTACGEFTFAIGHAAFLDPTYTNYLAPGTSSLRIVVDCDCNLNGVFDVDEIAEGDASDCNENTIPDECESDCNLNGIVDACDMTDCDGSPACGDCNQNGIPDSCDIAAGAPDDNSNGVPDECFVPIPTVTHWGVVALALALLIGAKVASASARKQRLSSCD